MKCRLWLHTVGDHAHERDANEDLTAWSQCCESQI